MRRSILIAVVVAGLMLGCAGVQPKNSVCDPVPPGQSLICEHIPSPETVDILLQLANVEHIKQNAYTKEEALKFLDNVETLLGPGGSTTYADLSAYVISQVRFIKERFGVEIFILSEYAGVLDQPVPISDIDRHFLKVHIDRQRRVLSIL